MDDEDETTVYELNNPDSFERVLDGLPASRDHWRNSSSMMEGEEEEDDEEDSSPSESSESDSEELADYINGDHDEDEDNHSSLSSGGRRLRIAHRKFLKAQQANQNSSKSSLQDNLRTQIEKYPFIGKIDFVGELKVWLQDEQAHAAMSELLTYVESM